MVNTDFRRLGTPLLLALACAWAFLVSGCAESPPAGERAREEAVGTAPPTPGPLGQKMDPTGQPQG